MHHVRIFKLQNYLFKIKESSPNIIIEHFRNDEGKKCVFTLYYKSSSFCSHIKIFKGNRSTVDLNGNTGILILLETSLASSLISHTLEKHGKLSSYGKIENKICCQQLLIGYHGSFIFLATEQREVQIYSI